MSFEEFYSTRILLDRNTDLDSSRTQLQVEDGADCKVVWQFIISKNNL